MINIKIIEEKNNPILKRMDFIFLLEHKGEPTPSVETVKKMLADKYKGDLKKTEIVYMFSQGGLAQTKVKAFIWEEKIVEKPKEKKKEGEEETAAPAEA